MRERITDHRAARPPDWQTLEAPIDTARQIAAAAIEHDTLILDCVTLMTSNILLSLPDSVTQQEANDAALCEVERLLAFRRNRDATWLVVSNEVGMGVVPPTRLGESVSRYAGAGESAHRRARR